MKTKLLAGAALALVIGVSSAAYANPKNTFSDDNGTIVESTAIAASVGHVNIGNGNGGNGGHGGGSLNLFDSDHNGGPDGGNGGSGGDVTNGSSTSKSVAISESYNRNNEGVSVQELTGVSAINVQVAIGGLAKIWNDGASASNRDTSGVTSAAAAAGNGSLNVQGVSIGAGAEVNF